MSRRVGSDQKKMGQLPVVAVVKECKACGQRYETVTIKQEIESDAGARCLCDCGQINRTTTRREDLRGGSDVR